MEKNLATKNLFSFFLLPHTYILRHYKILYNSTLMEVRHNNAGSIIGALWLFLAPLILLSLYAFIYAVVFKFRPQGMTMSSYILYIFCGLISYLGFNNGIMIGISSLVNHKQILLNTIFPAELLPVRAVLSGSTVIFFGYFIICFSAFFLATPHLAFIYVPFFIFMQLIFVVGLCWILSLVTLVVRDIQQFLGYIMTLLFIISPIGYTPDMIPENLRLIIYLNPLSYYVLCYQNLIMLGKLPDTQIVTILVLQSTLMFSTGFWVFRRMKRVFFDYA